MGLPDSPCGQLAIDLSAFLDLSIDMPGGVSIQAKLEPNTLPTLSGIVQSMLGPLNAAMTPLMPFFRLLDLVIAIVDFCKAIPDSLGPPPDPTLLVKVTEKLIKAAAKVVGLLPPLSLPIMIVGVCKTISAALLALVGELKDLIQIQTSLDLRAQKVDTLAANPETAEAAAMLQASIDCAQADIDLQAQVGGSSLGPLNKFLDLLNAFLGLIGIPEIGKVSAGGDPTAMIEPLETAVTLLATICGSIPV